jgi:hypothetical protein
MATDIEVGDIVNPGFYGSNTYGVVIDVSVPHGGVFIVGLNLAPKF